MADEKGFTLFGFEIKRQSNKDDNMKSRPSIVPPRDEDGAGYITASGSYYGQYVDIEGNDKVKDQKDLIMKYRGVSMHPEVDAAIEDIVDGAIAHGETSQSVDIILDNVDTTDQIKKVIKEEFDNIYSMLNFDEHGHDIFRKYYVDGRMYHHLVVDEKNLKGGITEIRPIDAAKIRKVKEVKTKKDEATGAKIVTAVNEYYVYQEKPGQQVAGIRLTEDSVNYVTSGLLDEQRKKVISYLHKALKPINQLRMMEDALVIYRISRAPERRIFYIDVGNLPKAKAEQYLADVMNKYRNKLVYNAQTGEIKDDRKHMSMLEDFWLPRREGGRGTEISTLPGGQNLSEIEDIEYFKKKLYRALNVPVSRMESDNGFNLGKASEIDRDELKFNKFTNRLQKKFARVFIDVLRTQLILKEIVTAEEFDNMKDFMQFNFATDNHFTELKDAEILRERLDTLGQVVDYVGKYYSHEYVRKYVLRQTEDDIKIIDGQIEDEKKSDDDSGMDDDGFGSF